MPAVMTPPATLDARQLIDRYDVLLLDAYGVLTHHHGPIPGAAAFIETLRAEHKPYFVVSNTSAKLPEACAETWRGYGLAIEAERIITSGGLLPRYFADHHLDGADCVVVGTPDTVRYVERAGARVVALTEDAQPAVMVVGDDAEEPFMRTMAAATTVLLRAIAAGRPLRVVLPNPDVIYPRGPDSFGLTSGALALLLEAAVARRYPERPWAIDRLGKPHPPIFEEALSRCDGGRVVMVGDQLDTDIAGANRAGIDSVLTLTGVSRLPPRHEPGAPWPTFLLESVSIEGVRTVTL